MRYSRYQLIESQANHKSFRNENGIRMMNPISELNVRGATNYQGKRRCFRRITDNHIPCARKLLNKVRKNGKTSLTSRSVLWKVRPGKLECTAFMLLGNGFGSEAKNLADGQSSQNRLKQMKCCLKQTEAHPLDYPRVKISC